MGYGIWIRRVDRAFDLCEELVSATESVLIVIGISVFFMI